MKLINDPRHNARRISLGALFCHLFEGIELTECIELSKELLHRQNDNLDEELVTKAIDLIKKNQKVIDTIIQDCAPDWPIDKISKIDLIILRMSIAEILFVEDVPHKVVVDEAIELAKEFGGDSSSKFVNGVLGTVISIKEDTTKEETA